MEAPHPKPSPHEEKEKGRNSGEDDISLPTHLPTGALYDTRPSDQGTWPKESAPPKLSNHTNLKHEEEAKRNNASAPQPKFDKVTRTVLVKLKALINALNELMGHAEELPDTVTKERRPTIVLLS
ncbi:hypothetical protein EBH_0001240 [Eimeria brunetti]|uniref:Uncharacterized protein n=1 Tax=Eimeria brunetti TaxID=51314 RepID=U6LN76_9EIME|nr:hypothetical protein EBH_0001240 [Eimeria brunetti]